MVMMLYGVIPSNTLVCICSDRCVKFNISHTKRNFYAACNSIFLHSHGVNDIALLHLQESYSLSVIMYAIPALSVTIIDK